VYFHLTSRGQLKYSRAYAAGKRLREMYDQWSPSNAEKEALDEMTLLPCQGTHCS
jgi:hypothetical protein